MALPLRSALLSAGRFALTHPGAMFTLARHALGMRVAIPLDAVRWYVINTPPSKKAPQDVSITSRPPAVGLAATIDLMNTPVRASGYVRVDEINVSEDAFLVRLRLSDVEMKVLGETLSPVAGLLKSGALDLSKPGNLVRFMPKKPDLLVEAHDDTIVIDLMRVPRFRQNDKVARVLGTLAPVVHVESLSTQGDYLIVQFRATPSGLPRALAAARTMTG